jgi:hypothetical protein
MRPRELTDTQGHRRPISHVPRKVRESQILGSSIVSGAPLRAAAKFRNAS